MRGALEFGILGPLEVRRGANALSVGPPSQRTVLATLLLNANRTVSVEQLVDTIWPDSPPATAVAMVQIYVGRVRKALLTDASDASDDAVIHTERPGYRLGLGSGALDLDRFEATTQAGTGALAAGDLPGGTRQLREALALWRGPALADIPAEPLRLEAGRLDELRIDALERCAAADLALGRYREGLAELTDLTRDHPFRERLWSLLMAGLYGAGRQAEALEGYQRARDVLGQELGLEPSAELQRIQQAILTGRPAADLIAAITGYTRSATVVSRAPRPAELPPAAATFTGRDAELDAVRKQLGADRPEAAAKIAGPIVISAVDGCGGVGKSTLAIRAAHDVSPRFPDGQLYVDLQGSTPGMDPLQPLEVLGRFLRSLGVEDGRVPADVAEAAARFRSLLADRRILVVLDNARESAQVRPLLPGWAGCGVLVTSRRMLAGLDGASHLHLDLLTPEESIELLARLIGAERVAAEAAAAAEVVRLCGRLPLALRIAGARLAVRPGWSLERFAARLASAQSGLGELEADGLGVRACIAVSWEEAAGSQDPIDQVATRAFTLLGSWDGPDISLPAVAALLDLPELDAEDGLERLVDARLLDSPAPGRYRMHDLTRRYARELAEQRLPEAGRMAALRRLLRFYASTCWQTVPLLRTGDRPALRIDPDWSGTGLELPSIDSALSWLESERRCLLAAVELAGAIPEFNAGAVQLCEAMFAFFSVRRGYLADWEWTAVTARSVAAQLGDERGEANALNDLGCIRRHQNRDDEGQAFLEEALAIQRRLGNPYGQTACLGNLATLHSGLGRYDEAEACLTEALAIDRAAGNRGSEGFDLANLGILHGRQGRLAQAVDHLSESLACFREIDDRYGQAHSLNNLGFAHGLLGQLDEALTCLEESRAFARELGNTQLEAENLRDIGVLLQRSHRLDEARAHWREALALFEQLGSGAEIDEVRALLNPPAAN
ncbi:AfsR/SARP family transcriptional regulator [Flindersiella endophytica]